MKNIFKKTMNCDEQFELDKEFVDELSSQLTLIHGVLRHTMAHLSSAWHIETAKDYPLMTMKKIRKDKTSNVRLSQWEQKVCNAGANYSTYVKDGWEAAFYTIEGVTLYMEKYYEIRSGHLETLFPKL